MSAASTTTPASPSPTATSSGPVREQDGGDDERPAAPRRRPAASGSPRSGPAPRPSARPAGVLEQHGRRPGQVARGDVEAGQDQRARRRSRSRSTPAGRARRAARYGAASGRRYSPTRVALAERRVERGEAHHAGDQEADQQVHEQRPRPRRARAPSASTAAGSLGRADPGEVASAPTAPAAGTKASGNRKPKLAGEQAEAAADQPERAERRPVGVDLRHASLLLGVSRTPSGRASRAMWSSTPLTNLASLPSG